jgi:hypothetical protein
MHSVCELYSFRRAASAVGMTDGEIDELVEFLAKKPIGGDEMPGTGGCRKLRIAGRGKGKSGGYRVITFYSGEFLPVFLITVFGKGEKANLTKGECNELRLLSKRLVEEYRAHAIELGEAP